MKDCIREIPTLASTLPCFPGAPLLAHQKRRGSKYDGVFWTENLFHLLGETGKPRLHKGRVMALVAGQ